MKQRYTIIKSIQSYQKAIEGIASQTSFLETKTDKELHELHSTVYNIYYNDFFGANPEVKDFRQNNS